MNREDEIKKAGSEYTKNYDCFDGDIDDIEIGFIDGAKWADENVSWDMIVRIWNLAVKTTIAQVNKEMGKFNSEKEITQYIKQALGL